ncbi:prepilin-type N-terminal cleavage/methylation domain-containing protein [Candidatus Parcubacteria bacterium]|nr:prepilin-type N-terminal cleavage/methylation domain-containing protein [Candidatus Parcubacteria bacterium]
MKTKKGFTLMELLIVIAIIGVLSAIVLASLRLAKSRGSDAAVQSTLASIRSQAEIYFDSNANYGDVIATGECPSSGTSIFAADDTIKNQLASVVTTGGGLVSCMTDSPASGNATKWAIAAQLKSDPLKAWCVDSNGVSTVRDLSDTTQAELDSKVSGGICN